MRASLRRTTHSLHQKLETLWTPDNRFATEDDYRSFLRALLKAHSEVGVRAAAGRDDAADFVLEKQRITALATDLEIGLPAAPTMPPLSADYSWGVGYVLNGSTLGAAIILKQNFVEPTWPSAYMRLGRAYVRAGNAKSFFNTFDSLALNGSEVERGAIDTFSLFDDTA